MCVGIANAVTDAVYNSTAMIDDGKKKRNPNSMPWMKKTLGVQNDLAQFVHWGPKVTTNDGNEYIFDWWLTLDIFNPIIFHYDDWRLYPLPGILSRGIEANKFGGFL